MARDDGITGIIGQVLHFPAICHPKFFPRDKYEFGSYIQNADNCVLSVVRYEAFLDAYNPNPEPDHRHSPLLATSLANLPPACKKTLPYHFLSIPLYHHSSHSCITNMWSCLLVIQCAGVDIFRDEAFAYAEALEVAGVDVEIYGYQGVPHCFPAIMNTHPSTPTFYERFNSFLSKHATSSVQQE